MTSNIILTGFSGTGKSHVGYLVSQIMGWNFIDTDDEITTRASTTIAEIFKNGGELKFRQMEKAIISEFSSLSNFVISTGGGAIVDEDNYISMKENGFIICLEASTDTINSRIEQQHNVRPLIDTSDTHEGINKLKSQRQHRYAMANWTVHTDHLTPIQVAREIVRAWEMRQDQINEQARLEIPSQLPSFTVSTKSLSYPVFVNAGILTRITEYLKLAGISEQIFVISDGILKDTHLASLEQSLMDANIGFKTFLVRSGEYSKSIGTAQEIYAWLVENRAERSSTLLALGGGVIGDLTGFVAATFLRGIKVIQVPTSLAAMVDASIGGKTAVNLPEAKNLVGAFHQPVAVYADLDTLKTLSNRELASGWAEAIKHGLILDKDLFSLFETRTADIMSLLPELSEHIISRSMEIKARVIEQDERETTGRRMLLNYGHTIGHGLEAASNYGTLLHGEAVSIGMMGAGMISNRLDLLSTSNLERQRSVLNNFKLPLKYSGIDPEDVLTAIQFDKKVTSKKMNWVLLEDIGKTCVRTDVPEDLVKEIVYSLCS